MVVALNNSFGFFLLSIYLFFDLYGVIIQKQIQIDLVYAENA